MLPSWHKSVKTSATNNSLHRSKAQHDEQHIAELAQCHKTANEKLFSASVSRLMRKNDDFQLVGVDTAIRNRSCDIRPHIIRVW
jgi:hypothetical protein